VGAARVLTREKAVVTGVALPERCCGATAELGTVMSLLALLVKKKKGRHSESPRDTLVASSSFNPNPRGNLSVFIKE